MPSVAFWAGTPGGTAEYRCYTPGKALQRAGWDVEYLDNIYSVVSHPDVIVFQRCLGDWIGGLIKNLRVYRPDSVLIYDIDDWYDGIPTYNPASQKIDPQAVEELHEAMSLVDLVTVSTTELAESYARWNHTLVLPNYLDPDIWSEHECSRYRTPRDQIHIGYTGSMDWRSADIELLKPWLADFLDDHPEVKFSTLGGGPEALEYLGILGRYSPKVKPSAVNYLRPYDHLPAMLSDIDIGLCPLVDNKFNRSKSFCKPLEYGAMGIPAVCSPSREYQKYLQPGINGQFVRKNNWRGAIERVLYDLPRYREGARKVAEQFYIDSHISAWTDAYENARAGT